VGQVSNLSRPIGNPSHESLASQARVAHNGVRSPDRTLPMLTRLWILVLAAFLNAGGKAAR